jgi:hypothetical protein
MLAAPGAMAQAPTTCAVGNCIVEAIGPTVVSCGSATCTEITYKVTTPEVADHIAAVVASGSTNCMTPSITSVSGGTGNQAYPPGMGDPVSGLGMHSCHDEAAKTTPTATVTNFKVTVSGARAPAPKSVLVKRGAKMHSCEILGIGEAGTPAPVTETLTHGDCAVEFTLDKANGTVIAAKLTDDSSESCDLLVNDVADLEVTLDGLTLGLGQFGDGYIHNGTGSCTTRIIGGKVYTFGSPCP